MYLTLDYIKYFMEEKKLYYNIDSDNFKNFLGIIKLEKKEKLWEICIKGPKDTLYEEGLFNLTISFPLLYPQKGPEIRFKNKIYHLNVSRVNGSISAFFLLNWNKNTSYAELLVGIYLFFIFEQNSESPYSMEMAREYSKNRDEFNKKAKLWTIKYASIKQNDYKEEDKKYDYLVKKVNKLEKDINVYSNKIIELLEKLNQNNQNEGMPSKLITIKFLNEHFKELDPVTCKETDLFINVESLLYKKYPQYLETEQYFIVNGKKIKRFKTLKENGIKDNDIVMLSVCDVD